jgi:uncharacterized membrane protein
MGGADEAYYYWENWGRFWEEDSKALEWLRGIVKPPSAAQWRSLKAYVLVEQLLVLLPVKYSIVKWLNVSETHFWVPKLVIKTTIEELIPLLPWSNGMLLVAITRPHRRSISGLIS